MKKVLGYILLGLCLVSLIFSIVALSKTKTETNDYARIKHVLEEKNGVIGFSYERIHIIDKNALDEADRNSRFYCVHVLTTNGNEYHYVVRCDTDGNTGIWQAYN